MKPTTSKILFTGLLAVSALTMTAADATMTPVDGYPRLALGADVSWTPYIETNHLHQYYTGTEATSDALTTIPAMLMDHGIDAVRLRVWVNPKTDMAMSGFTFTADGYEYEEMSTYGTCSVDEMVALAKRLAKQGHRVMVSFQLSDMWADPGRQFIPEAWNDCTSVDDLSAYVCGHITEVLTLLHNANVNVAWTQIGNEVNNGMLKWKVPSASGTTVTSEEWGCEISQKVPNVPSETTKNFVRVFTDASRAAKEIYPGTKTVLHLTKTVNWSTLNWSLNLLDKAGFSTDICDYIGLSLYPGLDDGQDVYTAKWKTYADLGITTINNIYAKYGFRTILAEMGMNNEYSLSANTEGVSAADLQKCYIDQCNTDVAAFTQYLIEKLDTDESTCDGLFYWEPETDYMKNYAKGACVSITPGASWPRDKVTANAWWTTVEAHSTFPAGGLEEYRINDDTTPDFVPDPDLKLYLYYYTNQNNFVEMTTTDGLLYTLTGYEASQWFNFKVATEDFSIALGNAEVGLNQQGILNDANDWTAWTSTAVSATDTWWYRHDTHAMSITADTVCPWSDIDSGVSTVVPDPDSTTPEYYNLQGLRIPAPISGFYIERRGSHTYKRLNTN
ncbi:MAG: arabinogalactan endo-1,4-beta-galactosidase [Bacteroidales bacterium]|nr:arabinogalactan endo-1,4-beta-galactosidase [Bacteroidales bacterium]